MITTNKIYLSNLNDPFVNLAVEEWIFEDLDPNEQILYLWRNLPTVVIGRCQNPWSECDLNKMETKDIHLARRTTGGGAVYQDLGNTNFTFLSPMSEYSKERNFEIIKNALKRFKISAYNSGRNDLLVDLFNTEPRKISGSAFREMPDRCFHHGTLLINADLAELSQILIPHPKKMQSKGVSSVSSRVTNLSELNRQINHENICTAIINEFGSFYGLTNQNIQIIDQELIDKNEKLKEKIQKFKSWDWRFGKTPVFTHEFCDYLTSGFYQVQIDSRQAKIEGIRVYSDCLFVDVIETLEFMLIGKNISKTEIEFVFDDLSKKFLVDSRKLFVIEEFKVWFLEQLL